MTEPLTLVRTLALISLWLLLQACAPEAAAPPAATPPPATAAASGAAATAALDDSGAATQQTTVNHLMNDTIDPAARKLWTAVSYVVTAEGTQETAPQTADDWLRLREEAETLLRAAATLQLPGLGIHADAMVARPDFQYTPAEIAAALADNPLPWRHYAHDMETTTLQILGSIERRDLDDYLQLGVALNQACEGCHNEYWYKPQPMRGAEGLR